MFSRQSTPGQDSDSATFDARSQVVSQSPLLPEEQQHRKSKIPEAYMVKVPKAPTPIPSSFCLSDTAAAATRLLLGVNVIVKLPKTANNNSNNININSINNRQHPYAISFNSQPNSAFFTRTQLNVLEEFFDDVSQAPNATQYYEISTELGLLKRDVMAWFRKRRMEKPNGVEAVMADQKQREARRRKRQEEKRTRPVVEHTHRPLKRLCTMMEVAMGAMYDFNFFNGTF
ncbi:hypothetical protein HK100_011025 [Physocladia obscura]|uniref:Homeobox domain-containing protein n=1 Tax=Physocladia obscura TaxID=109957 RepID=A0AAD5T371_9FUNG|nr:hypothetical protein HK100_011025 [Physocladia obscura]